MLYEIFQYDNMEFYTEFERGRINMEEYFISYNDENGNKMILEPMGNFKKNGCPKIFESVEQVEKFISDNQSEIKYTLELNSRPVTMITGEFPSGEMKIVEYKETRGGYRPGAGRKAEPEKDRKNYIKKTVEFTPDEWEEIEPKVKEFGKSFNKYALKILLDK